MSDPNNHELLSAYLDGELPAHERARVERLLSEDADCRKVYGELLALRASLADLPRHRLDEDLGPRVIRLAEEALREKQSAEANLVPASLQAADRRARRWRTIIYPLAVAAAAVVMLIAAPREKRNRDMARAPREDAPLASVSAAPSGAASAPAAPAAAPEDAGPVAAGPANPGLPASGPAPARHFGAVQLDEVNAPSASGSAVGSLKSGRSAGFDDADATSDSAGSAADEPAPSDSKMPAEQAEAESIAGRQELRLNSDHYRMPRAAAKPQALMQTGSQATLVLECRLAPAAIRDKAFDLLLARNHLAAVAAPTNGAPAGDRKSTSSTRARPTGEQGDKTAAQDKPLAMQKSQLGIINAEKRGPQSVLVAMKPEQLVALLADLQNHPDQFLSVQLSGRPKADANEIDARATYLFALEPADKLAEKPAGANRDEALAGPSADSGPQPLVVLFRLSEGRAP